MDVYDTIYSILSANENEIRGRTVIQKLVYLSGEKIPQLDIPQYNAHYYGPFSRGVEWALEKMVSYSFLYETNNPGIPYEWYAYRLTPDGEEIVKKSKQAHGYLFKEVAKIVHACKEFCGLKALPLSYASKIHYLYEHEPNMQSKDAAKYAENLGWEISKDDVERGTKLLERLGLGKSR